MRQLLDGAMQSFPERCRAIAGDDDDAISSMLNEGAIYAEALLKIEAWACSFTPDEPLCEGSVVGIDEAKAHVLSLLPK